MNSCSYNFSIDKFYKFNSSEILQVLKGEKIAAIFKNIVDINSISSILDRFKNNPNTVKRGDIVPAYMLGAFHYGKELDSYFNEVVNYKDSISNVFLDSEHFFEKIIADVSSCLKKQGISLRPARYRGISSNPCVIRSCWSDSQGNIILAHEDAAQLYEPAQQGFEIQKCRNYPVLGVNICLQDDTESVLRIWDYRPSEKDRAELGLENKGYPYPFDVLKAYDCIEQEIRAGDLYFFDARNVHAVTSSQGQSGYRTTLSCFMSFVDDTTVIYWT
ncbi:2OG-Fe(II)-dependent halogenase WelO5 family protein [Piscirickettsia litoralis]|uniref:Fe2OG dioxygenase domain-containing protein n=1 Tax=Piscirickettsia litoralis TaxID=1891921 RepID=A0ABX3A344_9GAMM|nr:hypothetical protein [Piscirickettsia litoralis]ODN43291.1 hypothetical protein BGC07_10620 [Piscirickettsia litoralis]